MAIPNTQADIIDLLSSDSEPEPEISVLSPAQPLKQSSSSKRNIHNISPSSSDDDSFLNDPYPKLRSTRSENPTQNEAFSRTGNPSKENNASATAASSRQLKRSASSVSQASSSPSKKENVANKGRTKQQNPAKTNKAVDKALKAAEAAARKSLKPGECMKRMTAVLDPVLLSSVAGGGEILTQLQALEVKCLIEQQTIPNAITWKRESTQVFVDENDSILSRSAFMEEDQALLVFVAQDFLTLVENQLKLNSRDDTIGNLVKRAKGTLRKRITVLVLGLEQHFKSQKTQDRRNYRAKVQGNPSLSSDLGVTRVQVESALLQLQLEHDCMCWLLESATELAATVARITKSVAEAPFKREKDNVGFEFYAPGESAGIKVDAQTGKGLARVWVHQLLQLPLASLETGQAVAAEYPSPSELMKAYEECSSQNQAALLLQDIKVRRGAGLLASTRRVGPEFSKKVHSLLTSQEGGQRL